MTTLHGRLDLPGLDILYRHFPDIPLVSISYNQRRPLAHAGWVGNVYHGLPENLYVQGAGKGGYAAFVGRISPEKRVDRAIAIAGLAGVPIKIAAKIDRADRDYFETKIKHLLRFPHVEFVGEISDAQKSKFLGDAMVCLFPIDWPEPFGMVMIESLACGTPVVAYDNGSVSEVLDHGRSGWIVNSIEEAAKAVRNVHRISRTACREAFVERFSVTRMAEDYLMAYKTVIDDFSRVRLPAKTELRPGALSANSLSA